MSGTITSIVGARPQFIKAATVCRAMARANRFRHRIVHTGQHFDYNMSQVFFENLEIPPPDISLDIHSLSHGAMTGRMLEALEVELLRSQPEIVIVYGDTNSTLAGALAAAKLHIPVAHVEAGLRSFNRRMPEETNRILADHCSDLLFTPTDRATANLRAEGIADRSVYQVGDVMYDSALHLTADQIRQKRLLEQFGLSSGEYALVTVHREENTSDHNHLAGIIRALETVSTSLTVLFPIHPRTRKALETTDITIGNHSALQVVEPLDYFDIASLEKHARVIATDSGGMQKEAYFFGVPCITLREETEWVELLDAGWNTLVSPTDSHSIADAILSAAPPGNSSTQRLYGDGHAAEKIIDILAGVAQG